MPSNGLPQLLWRLWGNPGNAASSLTVELRKWGVRGYTIAMSDAPESTCKTRRRWFRSAPDRVVLALLPLEGLLILSEWFRWFPFNAHKGWTVLVAIAGLGAALLLMSLWFLAALLFRLRFQFSILALLVLMLAVAIPLSWLAVEREQAREQRAAADWIGKAGGWVLYDYQPFPSSVANRITHAPGPAWLRKLLGEDHFADVTFVNLNDTQVSDAGLEHLEGLPRLQTLWLDNTKVSDAGLERLKGLTKLQLLSLVNTKVGDAGLQHLKGLTQLQGLSLVNTKVSDAGLEHLRGLIQLQALSLVGTKVSDAGLQHLKGLTQLQWLSLVNTKVSDARLEHLKGLTQLQELYLDNTKVSDAGLEHLKGLTQLQELSLVNTKISDAGLQHLKGLTELQMLRLNNTNVSDAGVGDLQKALPSVGIVRGQ